jgi:hypothetical protein
VGLLGHQDDDALLARLDQTALGARRQGIVEVGQQGLVVEAPSSSVRMKKRPFS